MVKKKSLAREAFVRIAHCSFLIVSILLFLSWAGEIFAEDKQFNVAPLMLLLDEKKVESLCADGVDNDGDGYTDCDDWDCDATLVCQ